MNGAVHATPSKTKMPEQIIISTDDETTRAGLELATDFHKRYDALLDEQREYRDDCQRRADITSWGRNHSNPTIASKADSLYSMYQHEVDHVKQYYGLYNVGDACPICDGQGMTDGNYFKADICECCNGRKTLAFDDIENDLIPRARTTGKHISVFLQVVS